MLSKAASNAYLIPVFWVESFPVGLALENMEVLQCDGLSALALDNRLIDLVRMIVVPFYSLAVSIDGSAPTTRSWAFMAL